MAGNSRVTTAVPRAQSAHSAALNAPVLDSPFLSVCLYPTPNLSRLFCKDLIKSKSEEKFSDRCLFVLICKKSSLTYRIEVTPQLLADLTLTKCLISYNKHPTSTMVYQQNWSREYLILQKMMAHKIILVLRELYFFILHKKTKWQHGETHCALFPTDLCSLLTRHIKPSMFLQAHANFHSLYPCLSYLLHFMPQSKVS